MIFRDVVVMRFMLIKNRGCRREPPVHQLKIVLVIYGKKNYEKYLYGMVMYTFFPLTRVYSGSTVCEDVYLRLSRCDNLGSTTVERFSVPVFSPDQP